MSGERTSRYAGKRSYVDESDGNSEENESESEGEVFTSRRTKRQRPSKANSVTPTSDENEIDNDSEEELNSTKKKTPYEAGQILRVDVENFMCHRKFTLELGRNLNFITGRNGSGKSAIAVAIQLCLGSSARNTGRGSNIGKLIREGSDEPAILKVKLLNKGQDAFKPELYGSKITVKRVITKNSGSTYHLLDHTGKEVTRLKSELESLLKALNIFVDTPCCILTQEESKRLIHGTAKEKYQFFLKATGLQSVYDDLQRAERDMEEATARKDDVMPLVMQRKADYEAARARVEEFRQLDGIEDKIRHQTALLLWDDVRSEQAVLDGLKKQASDFEEAVELAQSELDADSGEDTDSQKIAEANLELERIQTEVDERAAAADAKQAEGVQLQRAHDKMKSSMREHVRGISEHETRIRSNEQEIRLLQEKARNSAHTEERVFLDQIAACEAEIVRLTQASDELKVSLRDANKEVAAITTEQNRLSSNLVFVDKRVNTLRNELQGLESGSGQQGKASRFGHSVGQLLDRISRHRFSGPVLGPIGMCVSIKEGCEKWNFALERSLMSVLRSFVVTNVQDRNTLYQMMKDLRCHTFHPIIMQHHGARFHTETLRAPNALAMSDALIINDDLVFNCLIDQLNMDHVALVESESSVLTHFVEQVNGEDRLKFGISRIVTVNATNVSYKQGNQSSEMTRPWDQCKNFLSNDTTAYAASVKEELLVAQQELQETRALLEEQKNRQSRGNSDIRRMNDEVERLSKAGRARARAKQDLESRLAEVQQSGQIDTTPIEEDNNLLRDNLNTIVFQKEQLQVEISAQDAKIKACQAEKAVLDKARADLTRVMDQQGKHLTKLITKQADANKRRANLDKDLRAKKSTLANFMATVEKQVAMRDEKVGVAKQGTANLVEGWDGEPLPLTNKDSKSAIDRRIRQLRIDLEEGKKKVNLEGYTLPILIDRFAAAKEAYASSKLELTALVRRMKEAESNVHESKRKWGKSYSQCKKETKKMFDFYAQKQGAAGTVQFDDEKEEMTLIVQMDSHDSKTKATDVKNLSGGERSYITLCLLLALGHVTESPFRLMDEYDVFMDEARRNDTLNSIQNHARDKGQLNRQIIVITPNTLASVKHSAFVRIVKMNDPIKTSAHGLQQQTID